MAAKDVSQTTLVIDIAPNVVRGAIVGMPKNGMPEIVFEREHIFQFNERMLQELDELLQEILKNTQYMPAEFSRQPEHVLVSLAYPWKKDDKELMRKLEDALVRSFGFRKGVAIDDCLNVMHKGAQSLYELGDTVFARMTHDHTSYAIYKDKKKEREAFVSFGYGEAEKKFATRFRLPERLAGSYISLAQDDLWDEVMRKKVEEVLEEAEASWLRLSREASEFPPSILLVSDRPFERFAAALLRSAVPKSRVMLQDPITLLASYSRNLL